VSPVEQVTPDADHVSTMLDSVRVRSVVYCRSELGAPWGFRVPSSPEAKFHLVLGGAAALSVDGGDEVVLESGDLVLLAHGSAHVMRDRARSRVRDLGRILEDHPVDGSGTMHYGGRGPKTLLVCGAFNTTSAGDLLAWLPPVLVMETATNGLGRWLDPMIDLVRSEGRQGPGAAAVVSKVADVFLTDVLCQYLASSHTTSLPLGPPSAEMDPDIAEAMTLMRSRSAEPWTIAALARAVGMSRSSFAARFQAAVGAGPIAYLTRLRLARAAGQLVTSTRPIAEVARASGYDNGASFSKAFVRQFGQPPGEYRRAQRGARVARSAVPG
jgi:AraC-like DNA-binding protein